MAAPNCGGSVPGRLGVFRGLCSSAPAGVHACAQSIQDAYGCHGDAVEPTIGLVLIVSTALSTPGWVALGIARDHTGSAVRSRTPPPSPASPAPNRSTIIPRTPMRPRMGCRQAHHDVEVAGTDVGTNDGSLLRLPVQPVRLAEVQRPGMSSSPTRAAVACAPRAGGHHMGVVRSNHSVVPVLGYRGCVAMLAYPPAASGSESRR
jgi:hypothetical protein